MVNVWALGSKYPLEQTGLLACKCGKCTHFCSKEESAALWLEHWLGWSCFADTEAVGVAGPGTRRGRMLQQHRVCSGTGRVPPHRHCLGWGPFSGVPSCLWGSGDEILIGWWLLWSSRRTRGHWSFPSCSAPLHSLGSGEGGRKVLSHKLTESSGTLIKINNKQKCFSHWTIKCSRWLSEVSYSVSKSSWISISQNFVCSRGKTPQNFNESSLAEGNHFTRNFLTSYHCTTLFLHLPAATIRNWWLHLHRWEKGVCGYWF